MNCPACGSDQCNESSLEVCALKVSLRWALEQVPDDLDLDHRQAKETAEQLSQPATYVRFPDRMRDRKRPRVR